MEPRFDQLFRDIVQQIKESQIKLGFSDEAVRLYYKKDGLESRLGVPVGSLKDTAQTLAASPQLTGTPLGTLQFQPSRGRLQVTVPPAGVRYIHQHMEASAFLVDIVNLFGPCSHASKQEVLDLFAQHGTHRCQPAPAGADFDFFIHFDNPAVDPYYYCFKQEGEALTYHRLTREDFVTRTS